MPTTHPLAITTPSDREIVLTRVFDAPRSMVWEALTKPEYLTRWLSGPPGWTMTRCEIEPRVGSSYRYEWRKDDGTVMGMGGVIREVVPARRLVATERFDQAWYPGEGEVSYDLTERDGQTTVTTTLRYESREARDAVARSGATSGMELGYSRLAELLAARRAGGAN
jgi:uncharacterized protein YndB with AHSA1/START domain